MCAIAGLKVGLLPDFYVKTTKRFKLLFVCFPPITFPTMNIFWWDLMHISQGNKNYKRGIFVTFVTSSRFEHQWNTTKHQVPSKSVCDVVHVCMYCNFLDIFIEPCNKYLSRRQNMSIIYLWCNDALLFLLLLYIHTELNIFTTNITISC